MSARTKIIGALAVLGLSLGVFGITLGGALWRAPQEEPGPVPVVAAPRAPAPGEQPERLRIPVIGVDAAVQKVGLTKAGAMATPSNFTDAAWYKYGPAPGGTGSAVLDGHVDNGLGLPGVFKRLGEIRPGDDIFVQNASGTQTHFVVESAVSYPYKEVPTDLVFNRADKARLNLITCEGAWVQGEKTYDRRLVVYAVAQQ